MDPQLKKGLLDACVLHILQEGDTYGYKLTQEISEFMVTSESSLYPVLRRLETQGCLETYSSEHSGRLRRYYRITAAGITRLNEYKEELLEQRRIIDYIIGGEDENG
ncbi:MAG: PadR family transcriptional regulator [Clostridiaceae bacterium]|nr:PadR family transcriptional regulator [Clostridiaceae bacterium]